MTETIITAIAATAFKLKVEPIDSLSDGQKKAISEGEKISILESRPARDKHIQVVLTQPICLQDGSEAREGYIYQNHWKGVAPVSKKLSVKWRSQRDNSIEPWRECNLTSVTMAIDFLFKKYTGVSFAQQAQRQGFSFDEPEDFYRHILSQYGDTTDHSAHTRALRSLGIESYFSYSLSISDLYSLLALDLPVVLGLAYKSSGHIVCCVGYDRNENCFYIHDPYGTRLGARDEYDRFGGEYDRYSVSLMTQIWVDMGHPHNPECGWGRVFTKVGDKDTGAALGL